MPEQRIKIIRQYCVSAMVLCLVFLGVYFVQEKTGSYENGEGTGIKVHAAENGEGQFIQMGEEVSWGGHAMSDVETSGWSRIFGAELPATAREQGDYCVLIKKRGAVFEAISEEMIYRKVSVTLRGASVSAEDIYRISGKMMYTGEPDVAVTVIPEEEKNVPLVREPQTPEDDSLLALAVNEINGGTEVLLEFNSVYEISVAEDEEFLYLSLVRPHEKYEKIVVIDPGHGGIDPGTSGGGVTEASINLSVVRYLKELLDERDDLKVYYTRLNNTLPDLSTRVEFANALHADMLISVHCNYNPAGVVNGVEVLYSGIQGQENSFNSEYLAGLCSRLVAEKTGLKERELVERSKNLHLIKYCTMPMALIEFGYMSNMKDLSIITTEEAQRGCAEAIYQAIVAAYEVIEE